MNNLFSQDNSKNAFKSTMDRSPRYANVNKIQIYDKPKKQKKYNIRLNNKNEYELRNHEIPNIHKSAPAVFNGRQKINYTQKQIFDIDNTKPVKPKEFRFKYTNEDKPLHKYQ